MTACLFMKSIGECLTVDIRPLLAQLRLGKNKVKSYKAKLLSSVELRNCRKFWKKIILKCYKF